MWWLLKAAKKTADQSTSFPLEEAPVKWMKVDLNDPAPQINTSKPKNAQKISLIREVKKPDKRSLRLPLQNLKLIGKPNNENVNKAAANNKEGFPVPCSWRGPSTPNTNLLHEKKFSVTTIKLPLKEIECQLEPSLEEKLKILKEQENYIPTKPRYGVIKSLEHEEKQRAPSEVEKKLCNWISLEIKPLIGRLEGSRRSASSIGKKLSAKSKRSTLWHEEFSHAGGRCAKSILLHNLVSCSHSRTLETAAEKKISSSEKEVCKPICHLLRVALPHDTRASPRISPQDQQNDIEKGGHGSTRGKLADYNMLVESLRRQKDARLDKEEARMLLCKGILHDNAQEYRKAIESYKEYLILCIKNGDKEGEATAYNFIACSLQEEQDLKLADTREISSAAAIQSALKCATLTERPDRQGVAVGNLGFTLFRQKEWVTAKACMVKYLQICIALKDIQGQGRAHYILGSIASQRKRYEEAIREFEASLKVAKIVKDTKMETLSKIMVGIAQGDNMLEKQEASL